MIHHVVVVFQIFFAVVSTPHLVVEVKDYLEIQIFVSFLENSDACYITRLFLVGPIWRKKYYTNVVTWKTSKCHGALSINKRIARLILFFYFWNRDLVESSPRGFHVQSGFRLIEIKNWPWLIFDICWIFWHSNHYARNFIYLRCVGTKHQRNTIFRFLFVSLAWNVFVRHKNRIYGKHTKKHYNLVHVEDISKVVINDDER